MRAFRRVRPALILSTLLLCRSSFAFDQNGLSEPTAAAPATLDKETVATAQKHYTAGVTFFKAKKYDKALIEFRATYEYTDDSDLLHNMSLCYENLGDYEQALKFERQFLDQKKDLTRQETDETRGRILRLSETLQGAKPAPSPAPATSSPALLLVSDSQQPSAPQATFRPSGAALGLMAGGGGLLLAGIGCSIGAYLTGQDLKQNGAYFADEFDALYSRGQTLDRAGIALEVVGGVSAAIGITLTIVEHRRSSMKRTER